MSDEARAAFGKRLSSLMRARGLTAKSICWVMGLDSSKAVLVRTWLNGKCTPSYDSLILLHRALKCEWEELFGE